MIENLRMDGMHRSPSYVLAVTDARSAGIDDAFSSTSYDDRQAIEGKR